MAGVKRRATIQVDADVAKAIAGLRKTKDAVHSVEKATALWEMQSEKTMRAMDKAGQASAGMFGGSAMSGLQGANASLKAFTGQWGFLAAGVGVAVGALSAAASKTVELAHDSLEAQAAFNNLKFGIEGAATASLGLVDDMTLAQSQVRALELGAVDSVEGFEDLVEAGSKLGIVMSGDAAKGVEDLTLAISRGSPKILDNLGITLSLADANKIYAGQIGKEVSALSEAEKAEAFRTVALQKALEAARAKNIEGGAAVEILRKEVEAMNAKTALLGAEESAELRLKTAITSLGDGVERLNVLNRVHGGDLKEVERAMRKYGISVEEAGGLAKVQAEIERAAAASLREKAIATEEAEAAQVRLNIAQEAAGFAAQAVEVRRTTEMMQAQGASTLQINGMQVDKLGLLVEEVKLRERLGNATREDVREAEHALRVARVKLQHGLDTPTRGKGRGGRKGPTEKQQLDKLIGEAVKATQKSEAARADLFALMDEQVMGEHSTRIAGLEREVELKRALGLETENLEQKLLEARENEALAAGDDEMLAQVRHDDKIRRIELENEAKEKAHEEEKARLAAEKKLQDARMAHFTKATQATVHGLAAATEAAIAASDSKGQAFLGEVGEFAGSRAKILGIEAATHLALAAVWGAAGNPIKATMEATAGGIAAAKAAALGGIAASLSAAGGGSAGGLDSGQSAFNLGGGAPSAPSQTAGTAPVSPLEQNGQPVPAANDSGGGTVVHLNVQGSLVDSGGQLLEMIEDAKASGRGLRGGY